MKAPKGRGRRGGAAAEGFGACEGDSIGIVDAEVAGQ